MMENFLSSFCLDWSREFYSGRHHLWVPPGNLYCVLCYQARTFGTRHQGENTEDYKEAAFLCRQAFKII